MNRPPDPGPPLTAGPEFCPDDPPSTGEYARAVGLAGLSALVMGCAWFAVALATGQFWGAALTLMGAVSGLVVLQASPHRSVAMGAIAVGAGLVAALLGYGLRWLPVVDPALAPGLAWYHPVLLAVGLYAGYWLAGPRSARY